MLWNNSSVTKIDHSVTLDIYTLTVRTTNIFSNFLPVPESTNKPSLTFIFFDLFNSADTVFLATISVYTLPIETSGPIIFDTAPINPGGNYDTETGGYTAPVNGYYQYVQ